jgi:hypothetical protein
MNESAKIEGSSTALTADGEMLHAREAWQRQDAPH